MNLTELSSQGPFLIVLISFCGVLLRTLQSLYSDQVRDLKADRDAWKELAERGSWLAQQGLHQAERSQGQAPALPVKTP
jgi:hypothetical protein